MANTLKFGAGNWATKEGSTLAYNDENGNFKPLPFDFTRASSATVVNKAGLIETVGSGEPRIDFLGNTKGALLLEPSRSNLVTYSEDLTQWNDYNASAVLSNETIYGKNAYKIVEDSTVNYHGIYLTNLFTSDGTNYIWSVYVKGAERRYVVLTGRAGISSNDSALIFDTQDGVWVLDSSSQNQALSAESVGNGWWRISMEGNPTSGAYDSYTIAASLGGSTYTDANYQGDGTSGIYVAMAQVEQGSYATSYIPTQGSAVTRIADACNNSANAQIINSTEGVLYAQISALSDSGDTYRLIGLNNGSGTNTNRIFIGYTNNNSIYAAINDTTIAFTVSSFDVKNFNKVAVVYNGSIAKLFINGSEVGSGITNAPTLSGLSRVDFSGSSTGANEFKGNTKDVRVYNTALTDTELQALTRI